MSAFISMPLLSTPFTNPSTTSSRPMQSYINPAPRSISASPFTPSFAVPCRQKHTLLNARPTTMLLDKPASDSLTSVVTDSRRRQLTSIITSSPVFQSAKLSITTLSDQSGCRTDADGTCLDDWIEMGSILEDALGRQATDVRVYQYYLPIYFWILRELDVHRNRLAKEGLNSRPFILGFSCPQGGGKTTMTTFMETLLRSTGRNVQIASLDDFYVTNKHQRDIADANSNNRLMQYRGMPGTHDLDLLKKTLDLLREGGQEVSIPRYDKTAFNGRGDRAPVEQWKHISETTDVVLLEGWCLGFEPVEKENLLHGDLNVVNNALNDFLSVYKKLDGMFIIEISNMDWVFDWRLQAERGTRAAGKPGLTDEQVIDFVSRFMPAYKQYSPQLYNRTLPLIPNHELHIEIDNQRKPVPRKTQRTLRG